MTIKEKKAAAQANFLRYRSGQRKGHYESYFIRANHPEAPKAFWIRYTLFSPRHAPQAAIGELWAIYFEDGQPPVAAKKEFPLGQCVWQQNHFKLQIGQSIIASHQAVGSTGEIGWALNYESEEDPLFFFPLYFYELPFPKAKSLVPQPLAVFNGELKIGEESLPIENWVGSQNHNWGSKHTDSYAWGQVAGFDNAPDSFLEMATAQIKVGSLTTPKLTVLVLRHNGREYRMNSVKHWITAKAKFKYFKWKFESEDKDHKIKGTVYAPTDSVVALRYYNPPGGDKCCLNSKLAACEVTIEEKSDLGLKESLYTEFRCAFEILTDDKESHGIKLLF